MSRVKLSSAARVIVDDSGVVLYSEFGIFLIEGMEVAELTNQVVQLLDGTRTLEEIIEAFPPDHRSHVVSLWEILERRGVLETVDDIPDTFFHTQLKTQERFFRAWTDKPKQVTRRIQESRVLIVGLEAQGIVAATQLSASGIGSLHLADDGILTASELFLVDPLQAEAVGSLRRDRLAERLATISPSCRVTTSSVADAERLTSQGDNGDLLIGTMLRDDLAGQLKWARLAHDAKLISCFSSGNTFEAIIGPVVVPGNTACWNCARLRMLANAEHPLAAHKVQRELQTAKGTSVRASLFPMAAASGGLLSLEALKVLSGYTPSRLYGSVLIQNLITLETSVHKVIPMPCCETCGGASAMDHAKQEGRNSIVTQDPDGLRETFSGWLDARTGIVSTLITRELSTFPSRSFYCVQALLSNYTDGVAPPESQDSCGGKGLTERDAIIGAMGEAMERYSASRFRVGEMWRSPLPEGEEHFLDPRILSLYDESQYECKSFPFVRFDPGKTHLWTKARWLDNGEKVWAPALMTFYNFPEGVEQPFCQLTTNGLAAGVDLKDASLRAVMELVERDAFMISWLCRLPGRRLLLDQSLDLGVRLVCSKMEECGAHLELYLLDVGLNIPVIVCLGLGDGKRWPGLTVSSAAHLSPRRALHNAILEQSYSGVYLRHLMLAGKATVPLGPEQVRSGSFLDHGLYYLPPERAVACNFLRSEFDSINLGCLPEPTDVSLEECLRRLQSTGVRVAIADVTSPDVMESPFRVVRALGINMQPIHCGHGLERCGTPRLKAFLNGAAVNKDVHPLC